MKLARTSTLLAGLLAGLLLVLSAPAGGSVTGSAAVDQDPKPAMSYGRTAFDATNHEREMRDRKTLATNNCLHKYAVRQARKMAEREEIWHQDLQRILADCHVSWVGENVAAGFPSGRSVVNDGWMKSPDHRENILARKFRLVEVAARKGDDDRWYAAQVFGKRA